MIDKIAIDGFQSLRRTLLELGNVTVIIGKSRSGKTAIVRAIRGMLTNNPVKGFLCDKGGFSDSKVVVVADGKKVGWKKGKSNEYTLDGKKFTKVGRACPDEILKALKIGEVDLGGGLKIFPNFHGQFDVPFLQAESGSTIARVLGETTNINKVILATKNARSDVLKLGNLLDVREVDLHDLKQKEKELEDFDKWIGLSEKLKKLDFKIGEIDAVSNRIFVLATKLDPVDSAIKLNNRKIKELDWIERVEKLFEEVDDTTLDLVSVEKDLDKIDLLEVDSRNLDKDIDCYSWRIGNLEIKIVKIGEKIEEVNKVFEKLEKICKDDLLFAAYKEKMFRIDDGISVVDGLQMNVEKSISIFEDDLKDFDSCPLCERAF